MRCSLPALWLLVGCGTAPYPLYWEDVDAAPTLSGVSPNTVTDVAGGATVVLEGTGLATARTVVFGGRNAAIVEADSTSVTVVAPAYVPGGGIVDVVVVTDEGMVRLERTFTYAQADRDWFENESVSAVVQSIDCPIEVIGFLQGTGKRPVWWCGLEMGWADASAWNGNGLQPGMAGDLSGIAEVSALPPPGQVRVYTGSDPRPLSAPNLYKPLASDEAISISTQRRLSRDLMLLEERIAMAEQYYWWWDVADSVTIDSPVATLFDDESCWIEDIGVDSVSGDTLELAGLATPDTTQMWLGFSLTESYGRDENYTTEAYLSTAMLTVDGTTATADPAGVVLAYDDYSGWMLAEGVVGLVGIGDLLTDVEYTVSTTRLGETVERGTIAPVDALTVTRPDLLTGDEDIDLALPLTVAWEPVAVGDDPSYLAIEIRVYDTNIDDPNWYIEVGRLVAHAPEAEGVFVIPAEVMGQLPSAPNRLDENEDLIGRWAEMTVVRHQLRKVSLAEGEDLVVDFVHAVQSMVVLESP